MSHDDGVYHVGGGDWSQTHVDVGSDNDDDENMPAGADTGFGLRGDALSSGQKESTPQMMTLETARKSECPDPAGGCRQAWENAASGQGNLGRSRALPTARPAPGTRTPPRPRRPAWEDPA